MSHYPRPITLTPQMKALRGATAISGIGLFGNGETPGYTEIELLAEAAHRAVADAGPIVPALNARSHGDIIRAADAWMAAHLSQPVRRAELAAALHISEPHLARLYRAGTGRTIVERLTELRLQVAKSLLLESTLSVTQVAGEVGIISFSHFNRIFKLAVGVTPGDYRRSGGNAYKD